MMMLLVTVLMFWRRALASAESDATTRLLEKKSTRELFALARKYGVDDEDVFSRSRRKLAVEKSELVEVLAGVIARDEARAASRRRAKWIRRIVIVCSFVILVVLVWEPLTEMSWSCFERAFHAFNGRKQLVVYASNHGSPAAVVGILASTLIDVFSYWTRISVLGSWVMPQRFSFLLVTRWMPSLPISTPIVPSSINVTPMILLYLLRFLQRRIEHFVGVSMQRTTHYEQRQERRRRRRERNTALLDGDFDVYAR